MRELGQGEGALWSGDTAGSAFSLPGVCLRAPLAPLPWSVGGWLAHNCRALLRAQRSLYSLPPPSQASFKSAPALAESELINMQNHSVTH